MKIPGRRNRPEPVAAPDASEVSNRSGALSRALTLGGLQLPADDVTRAKTVLNKVAERSGIGAGRTVIAIAGATGSGKSSLFNMLVGEPVSRISARRPTTSRASAALWGKDPATELLDWLDVPSRHHVHESLPGYAELDGLVLLDLPDFDSRVAAHRAEADRVLERSDVFVWVTDPQKYADALLHNEYVSQLAKSGADALVVLNQVDRLTPEAAQACRDDLVRLLAQDGLPEARVIMTSTTTQEGADELHEALAAIVQHNNASATRLLGDVRLSAQQLSSHVAAPRGHSWAGMDAELVDALADAAGVNVALDAVERDFKQANAQRTGWPFTRWAQGLKAKPLSRLGLDKGATDQLTRGDVRLATGRSSLPPASPAARAAVALTTRRVAASASEGLPAPWADEIYRQVNTDKHTKDDALADALDQAVMSVPLRGRFPAWWGVASVLQWVFAAVALVGALWLFALFVLGFVQITPATPKLGGWLPWPLLLLVSGLLCGFLLALVCRAAAASGARKARQRAETELHEAIRGVAQERVLAPITSVVDRHDETAKALAQAAA